MNQNQQSRLKELIAKGKEQGYLTYAEVNDHLPEGIVDPDQVEEIIAMINDLGVGVHEAVVRFILVDLIGCRVDRRGGLVRAGFGGAAVRLVQAVT